jgi:hypothetical protein
MTAVGRPQFSAGPCLETAGRLPANSVRRSGRTAACGTRETWRSGSPRGRHPSCEIGSWFAGTIEAPGALGDGQASGRLYSRRAGYGLHQAVVHDRFDRLDSLRASALQDPVQAEVESPHRRSTSIPFGCLLVEDLLDMITSRCSLVAYPCRRGQPLRVPQAGTGWHPVRGRLRGGQGAPGQLVGTRLAGMVT